MALLTVKHRERRANLPAVIASKWVTQQYKIHGERALTAHL